MKRRAAILITFSFILGCTAVALFLPSPSTTVPASMTFLYYTNRQKSVEERRAIGDEPEAVFQLTNRMSAALRCDFSIDASNAVSGLVSYCSGSSGVSANAAYLVYVVVPEGTNAWQFTSALSTPIPPTPWQWRLALLLSRVGAHPRSLTRTKTYQTTNVWIAQ
jgi:hypothetical protein